MPPSRIYYRNQFRTGVLGDATAERAGTSETGLLFTQTAQFANITLINATYGELTLHGVSPVVTWFTDRPQHKVKYTPDTQLFCDDAGPQSANERKRAQ